MFEELSLRSKERQQTRENSKSIENQNQVQRVDLSLQVYLFLEEPYSTRSATTVSIFLITFIFLSIGVIILDSVREIHNAVDETIWLIIEIVITLVFTVEYITRFCVCHKGGKTKLQFILNFMNLCDLLSTFPLYIELFVETDTDIRTLRILRMVRLFRLLKLGKYSDSLKLFWTVGYRSREPLSIFFSVLAIALIFYGSIIYLFESGEYNKHLDKYYLKNGEETLYTSIPAALWWAIVTMSTVGYGDMYPKTLFGKIVGSFTVITGIFVIVLPVGIITNEFTQIYEEFRQQKKKKDLENSASERENNEQASPQLCIQSKEQSRTISLDFEINLQNIQEEDLKQLQLTLTKYEKATMDLKKVMLKMIK